MSDTTQQPPTPPSAAGNTRILVVLLMLAAGMVGLSFAAVPLYDLFCRVTGFGGTTQRADAATPGDVVLDREFRVRFVANTDSQLGWDFAPDQREVTVRAGESALISYTATNPTDEPLVGSAVFNVTPLTTGLYFVKTQCFCFDHQILMPGETVTMPVLFHVDPAIAEDRNLDDITTITLSYTFFESDSEAFDEALAAYYAAQSVSNGS